MFTSIRILVAILIVYFLFGIGYMVVTPQWQNPDEPAHYNYIRYLAENGNLPIMQDDDYNQEYLESSIRKGFPPNFDISPLRYEFHQPPLYYFLSLPVYLLGKGKVLPLRFFSLILGACLLVIVFFIGKTIAPTHKHVVFSTVIIVGFIPQHIAMMASINNDALAGLLMAMVLLLALRERLGLSKSRYERILLGSVVGLSFLTKLTVAIAYPVALYAYIGRIWEVRKVLPTNSRLPITQVLSWMDLFVILLLPLLIALPLWFRNAMVYGWPDIFALMQHASAVASQPKTVEWIAVNGFWDWLMRMIVFTFQSFWGQFGWMAIPMRRLAYIIILIFCSSILINWVIGLASGTLKTTSFCKREVKFLLLFSLCLTCLLYLVYNSTYVQHQGRYLFSGLVPLCFAMSCAWRRIFVRFSPDLRRYSTVNLFILLILLNLYALFGVLRSHLW